MRGFTTPGGSGNSESHHEKAALLGGLISFFVGLFHQSCRAKRLIDTALLHGFQAFCRNTNGDFFVELRYKDGLLLDVDLIAGLTRWVEFGCTRAVRITTPDAASLSCDDAFSCHMRVVCYHSAERYANRPTIHHFSDSHCHVQCRHS